MHNTHLVTKILIYKNVDIISSALKAGGAVEYRVQCAVPKGVIFQPFWS